MQTKNKKSKANLPWTLVQLPLVPDRLLQRRGLRRSGCFALAPERSAAGAAWAKLFGAHGCDLEYGAGGEDKAKDLRIWMGLDGGEIFFLNGLDKVRVGFLILRWR